MKNNLNQIYSARGINNSRLDAIFKFSKKRVLDIGCGSGIYVQRLSGEYEIKGIDHDFFESWSATPELFSLSDIGHIPFADNSFETGLLFEVLEHVADPVSALLTVKRVISNNLIITVPNCAVTSAMKKSGLIYNHWIDPTHVNFFSKDSLEDTLNKAGFDVLHFEYINRCNLGWLIAESFGLPIYFQRLFASLFARIGRSYYMTMLVVAQKS